MLQAVPGSQATMRTIASLFGAMLVVAGPMAQSISQFDQVAIGASTEDVERTLGKPEWVVWSYDWNELNVAFEDGVAVSVGMEARDGNLQLPVASGMTVAEVEAILGPPKDACYNYEYGPQNVRAWLCFSKAGTVISKKIIEVPVPKVPLH